MTNRPADEDIARKLRDDDATPPRHLDDRIRAAAREAAAQNAATDAAPRRRWRVPVGLAAAASVMLAVLVVRQAPEPAFDTVTAAAHRVAPRAEDATAREERAVDAARTRPLQAPAPASAPPTAQAAEAKASVDAGQDAAALEGTTVSGVAAGCAGKLIDLSDYQVCVDSDHIEVRSPERCRGSAGVPAPQDTVTARVEDQATAVVLMVDDIERWRVRCANDRWTITPVDDG